MASNRSMKVARVAVLLMLATTVAQANHNGPSSSAAAPVSALNDGRYASSPESLERYTRCMEELTLGITSNQGWRSENSESTYPRYPRSVAERICRVPSGNWQGLARCVNRVSFAVYDDQGWRHRRSGELYPTLPPQAGVNLCLESGNPTQAERAQACVERYAYGITQEFGRQKISPAPLTYPVGEAIRLCEVSGAFGPVGQCVARNLELGVSRTLAAWACQSAVSEETRACVRRFQIASFGMVSDEAVSQACLTDPQVQPAEASALARCLGTGSRGEHLSEHREPRVPVLPGAPSAVPAPLAASAASVAVPAR